MGKAQQVDAGRERDERDMDERVTALKGRLGVPDRPVESRTDLSIVRAGAPPREWKPRAVERGLPGPKHCKGCRAWFQPGTNAQRYCEACRNRRGQGERPVAFPEVPEVASAPLAEPLLRPEPLRAVPEPAADAEVDGGLADRLFARLERVGVRLFTSELAGGVPEDVGDVKGALIRLVEQGRVECVMSWKVKRP